MSKRVYGLLILMFLITLVAGIVIGYFSGYQPRQKVVEKKPEKAVIWTCSMHPQVKQNKPGKCPICFMDLIPMKDKAGSQIEDSSTVKLSPAEEKLAEVEVVPVERRFVEVTLRLPGKVEYDETRLAYVTARIPGRIDRLYINYTGVPVRKGDHMAEYYSPDILVAQQELLIEYRSWLAERGKKSSEAIRAGNMFAHVKKRLDLWGLTNKNILEILKSGKVRDHVTLYAPIKGIVIHKNAVEGKYFKTGDRLFTLADLSKLWVNLDAYESDLKWLRYGQKVVFTTDAWPGETFSGRISFISPVMDKQTRTVNVRLNVDNSSGRLKPEMIVSAVVKVRIDRDIKVIAADLKDKWMCPMHPSVLKSKPGKCDICGMDLLKTEELGYASGKGGDSQPPLVIPDTAPLLTGKRAVVYVKSAPGSFQAREVVLGPRAGGYYVVKKGLRQGDLVVTKGNFKIDSELQIKAGKSMMSMPSQMRMSDKEHKAHEHHKVPKKSPDGLSAEQKKIFAVGLQNVYSVYFVIQQALSKDNLKSAIAAAKDFKGRLSKIKKPEQDVAAWEKLSSELKDVGAEFVKTGGNIVKARELFRNLSSVVYRIAKRYGSGGKIKIYRMFCPMAFDNKGAYWLQDKPEVTNPYYGSVMYRCGSKEEDVAK